VKGKILSLKIKDSFTIDDLKQKLNLPEDELKVVLEILKEECLVIEKRKGKYQLV
jgi:predicted transcriptional regulator